MKLKVKFSFLGNSSINSLKMQLLFKILSSDFSEGFE